MKTKDLVMASMLGACGGLSILTTRVFHALIPLPGFGALFSLPFSSACLIIARARIKHPLAATMTKLIQQIVIFMLPGGSPNTKNPLLVLLMSLDGLMIDLIYRLWPAKIEDAKIYSGLLVAITGSISLLNQVLILYIIMGEQQFLLARGIWFFAGIFVVMHGLLRFLGGVSGSVIVKSIPERNV